MPPEAFTNKELAQAMHWRESQPEYVKAMTTTPETLISLYKKAMRTAPGMGNHSKMSESFRSDLKNIANGLKEFEPIATPPAHTGLEFAMTENSHETPRFEKDLGSSSPRASTDPTVPNNQAYSGRSSGGAVANQLDEGTLSMIREVKTALNLSSDNEALRMLVKLGFDRARGLLPPSLNI